MEPFHSWTIFNMAKWQLMNNKDLKRAQGCSHPLLIVITAVFAFPAVKMPVTVCGDYHLVSDRDFYKVSTLGCTGIYD